MPDSLPSLVRKFFYYRRLHPVIAERGSFLYYPIPKVASSSIKRYIIALLEGKDVGSLRVEHNGIHAYPLPRAHNIRGEDFRDFAHLVIARNPFSRIASCYRDKILGSVKSTGHVFSGFIRYNRLSRKQIFHPGMCFGEFCRVVSWIPDSLADGHFRSQHRFFPQTPALRDRLTIVHQEKLDQGMAAFCEGRGLPPWPAAELRENPSMQAKNDLWDSASVRLVRARYGKDFSALRYDAGHPTMH